MIDTHGRKAFDRVFDATANRLLRWGFAPNQVTATALITGLSAGAALYLGWKFAAAGLLWLSGFFDAVDGSMARQSGKPSHFGSLLDIVSDRIVELAVFWALALRHPESLTAMLGLVSAVLLSMTVFLTTGMLAANNGKKSFYYQAGLMERTEGFIASTAMMLFQSHLTPITWIYAALIGITVIQRLAEAVRLLKDKN